jgi:hypothetical protein
MVVTCYANSTYMVCELDGLVDRVPYASKKVKLLTRKIKFLELEDVDPDEESEYRDQDDDSEEAQD